jgi:transcriptional regulator with XRE-family HTH domain
VNGSRVAELRGDLRLSRSALARFLGVSDATVIRWEKDGGKPRGIVLLVLQAVERCATAQGFDATRRIVLDGQGSRGPALARLFEGAAS